MNAEILNEEKYSWIAQGWYEGRADGTKCSKLNFGPMGAAAGQVRKSEGIGGVGLSDKNYRQFSLLLDPTTSVGGEADQARVKQFTFAFFNC